MSNIKLDTSSNSDSNKTVNKPENEKPKRLSLEEFLTKDPKVISTVWHETDDTAVNINVVTIKEPNNEWLRFDFEKPVFMPIDKIYCNTKRELMVIAKPFIYIDYTGSSEIQEGGCFYGSKAFDIRCDICDNVINMITTDTKNCYCETCFESLPIEKTENTFEVMSHSLMKLNSA